MYISKKLFFLVFIISLINCEKTIQINAELFPSSNKIIYNGELYAPISQISSNPSINYLEKQKLIVKQRAIPFSAEFWFNLIIFIILACFAGMVSGLTVGYLSIDTLILEIKMNNGDENEKYYAKKIYNLVSNHHWLLVTLLLCNSFACEAMPIILDRLVNEIMAIILSMTVLLFVGEIIPQALCTGPNQMKIASFLAPITSFLMYITYPISYPIAKFMDYVIGVHGKNRFCNSDLKSLIELHVKEIIHFSSNQMGYFTGFLDIMNKKIGELILPIEKVLKIDFNSKINKNILKKLIDSGYSRIPVYENNSNHLIGILRMKQLVGKDLTEPYTLSQLGITLSQPIHVYENTLFLDLFEKFKGGKSHMAFIHKQENENKFTHSLSCSIENEKKNEKNIPLTPIKGIVTLEDLIEFWLKIPIFDEEDYKTQHRVNNNFTDRQNSLLDLIGIEKMHDKLNKLYDSRSNMKKQKEQEIKINNNDFSNNYYAFKDQKDE